MTPCTASIYTGRPGRSPLDPTLWSSIAHRLFTRLDARGALRRAIGVELSRPAKCWHLAPAFAPNRARWKARFQWNPGYRSALTRHLGRRLRPDDYAGPSLQIGAMFDAPSLWAGRAACYSYNDGNLAERLASPLPSVGLSPRAIDRALAYERRVAQGMTRVFTFSRYLRDSFVRNYGLPSDRVVAVGAGINLDRLPEPSPGRRYDTGEVLFIGVDFPRKGGPQLLRAFAAVREKVPAATLHVVGPAPATVAAAGPTAGVVCHGFLSKGDPAQASTLDELFGRASLFVMPSLYEPFGIAPLEAMAHQVPCLVSDGWALAELVDPGQTGELAAPGDVDDLAAKLRRLLAAPDALARMGRAGRERVAGEYQWDAVVDRLVVGMDSPSKPEPS